MAFADGEVDENGRLKTPPPFKEPEKKPTPPPVALDVPKKTPINPALLAMVPGPMKNKKHGQAPASTASKAGKSSVVITTSSSPPTLDLPRKVPAVAPAVNAPAQPARKTFDDWLANEQERKLDLKDFRPNNSRKAKKAEKAKAMEPRVVSQTDHYELGRPTNNLAGFPASDMSREVDTHFAKRVSNAGKIMPKKDAAPPAAFWNVLTNLGLGQPAPNPQASPNKLSTGIKKPPQHTPEELAAKRAIVQAQIDAMKAKNAAAKKSEPASPTPPAQAAMPPSSSGVTVSQAPVIYPQPTNTAAFPTPPAQAAMPPNTGAIISGAPIMYTQPINNAAFPTPPSQAAMPPSTGAIISGAPVIYEQPINNAAPGPSMAIKKAGFGMRMLKKQGWTKGEGLGANSDGITTALTMKRKTMADSEGGGPKHMGRIVGGKKAKTQAADEEVKNPSVIKISNMLTGLDVMKEIESNHLYQEIGNELGAYGNVERMHIWLRKDGGNDDVFVKFITPASALTALEATHGAPFAGNAMQTNFFDEDKFDAGEYY